MILRVGIIEDRLQQFNDKQNMSGARRKIKEPGAIAAIKKGLKVSNSGEHQIERLLSSVLYLSYIFTTC